jgi:prepilin-type N-terminal cleavage/methylation domain-containing protein
MRIAKSGERRAEGQNFGRRSRSGSRLWTLDSRLRTGVTLVELLITIMIISILAAAVLGVAAVAGETARESKTRTIISRIHTLLMQQYDTYTTRRVKVRPEILTAIKNRPVSTAVKGRMKAEARLYALREMMLMEVPDRWSDVLLNSVGSPPQQPVYLDVSNTVNGRTEVANLYLRTLNRIASSQNKNHPGTNTVDDIVANQCAECLYMVVMNACGDGESRTLFPESSIGDTDGDGAPEFIDGWGHPIQFLRWAPGFESDIQLNAVELDDPAAGTRIEAWQSAGTSDHDPFDLYRAQPEAYRLTPLVYSLGRDEEGGLANETTAVVWRPGGTLNINNSQPYFTLRLDPYLKHPSVPSGNYYFGTDTGEKTATDNIHNHLIGTR